MKGAGHTLIKTRIVIDQSSVRSIIDNCSTSALTVFSVLFVVEIPIVSTLSEHMFSVLAGDEGRSKDPGMTARSCILRIGFGESDGARVRSCCDHREDKEKRTGGSCRSQLTLSLRLTRSSHELWN